MNLPIEQHVFRKPHIVVEIAETFKGLASVRDVCCWYRFYDPHRRGGNELLELQQVSSPSAQAPWCAVGQRSSNRGVISLTVSSYHTIDYIGSRYAIRIDHQAERSLACA